MQPPPIPTDEAARLAALYRLALLDTPACESFDRITRLAAKAMGVPMLLVSLVDTDRQWFKSCIGLDATQTSREVSFCGHAVFERRPLIVPDATKDPRFAGNPLVTGPPYVRAYLGIPVFTLDHQPIGTLCAIDVLPRNFTDEEIGTMHDFADILEETINANELAVQAEAVLHYAAQRERLFRETFEESAVGIVHAACTGRLQRVNQRACDLLGFDRTELHAIPLLGLTQAEDAPRHAALLEDLLANQIPDYRIQTRFRTKSGEPRRVLLSVALAKSESGQPDHLIVTFEGMPDSGQRRSRRQAGGELRRL